MEENRQSIFQEILFPDLDIVGEEQLYYHCDKGCVCAEQAGLEIKAGSYVDFHSYFNAFSCGKWHQYTEIDSVSLWLELKGTAEVIISHNQFIYGGTGMESRKGVSADKRKGSSPQRNRGGGPPGRYLASPPECNAIGTL